MWDRFVDCLKTQVRHALDVSSQAFTIHAMELEPSTGFTPPAPDKRPHMPSPPPVTIVAVDDPHLPGLVDQGPELVSFYVDVLKFERDEDAPGLVFRAENLNLYFDLGETVPPRDDFRMLGVVVPNLGDVMRALIDCEIEFTRQRGLTPGGDAIVCLDPAGNWVQINETSHVR